MIRVGYLRRSLSTLLDLGVRDDRAAQLVEFAVSLPLLVLFVVGIFDFSNAFTLKQKLTNVARDAARTAAAEPSTDLQTALPISIVDAFQDIDNYLLANNLSDCGATSAGAPVGLTWKYTGTAASCPPGGLTILINRGYYFPGNGTVPLSPNCTPTDPAGQTAIISTCVSIQYAYPWKFGKVASLFGVTSTLPNTISTAAVAMNEN
jgi:Flp pilus assembly protein TadG